MNFGISKSESFGYASVVKMSNKRSVVSPQRLKVLKQENSVYTILCEVEGCTCSKTGGVCYRGFFSLFIQAVYGIAFAKEKGIPFYVDFGSRKYLYSDPKKGDENFWNYYFQQPIPKPPKDSILISNLNIENYPLRIWNKQHFLKMNKEVVSKLQFQDDVFKIIEEKKILFGSNKVLGVQVRGTDHAQEILPVKFEKIIREIEKRIGDFDLLFVATDESNVITILKEKFGSKVIWNEVTRSANGTAVHMNFEIRNRYNLGKEVLIDCFCLSLCNHAVLLQSNISYAALLFNPLLSYTLLERAKVRRKRMKTLLLYFLDKLEIRKW